MKRFVLLFAVVACVLFVSGCSDKPEDNGSIQIFNDVGVSQKYIKHVYIVWFKDSKANGKPVVAEDVSISINNMKTYNDLTPGLYRVLVTTEFKNGFGGITTEYASNDELFTLKAGQSVLVSCVTELDNDFQQNFGTHLELKVK
jgi:hypothetical protein